MTWFVRIVDADKGYQRITNLIREAGGNADNESITVLHSFSSHYDAFRLPEMALMPLLTTKDLRDAYILYAEPKGANTTLPFTPEIAKKLNSKSVVYVKDFLDEEENPFIMPGVHPAIVSLAKHYFIALHLKQKTFSFYKLRQQYSWKTLHFEDLLGEDNAVAIKLNEYGLKYGLKNRKGKWCIRVVEHPHPELKK